MKNALYCEVSNTYDPPVCSECGKAPGMAGHVCHVGGFLFGGIVDNRPIVFHRDNCLSPAMMQSVKDANRYHATGRTSAVGDMILNPANVFAALEAVKQNRMTTTPSPSDTDENYDAPRRF